MKWLKIALFLFLFTLFLSHRWIVVTLLIVFLSLLKNIKERMVLLLCCSYLFLSTNIQMDKPLTYEGKIEQIKNGYYIVMVEHTRILMYTQEQLQYSDMISFEGNYEKINSINNFYTFNFEKYSHNQGINYSINPTTITLIRHKFNIQNIVYQNIQKISDDVRKQQFLELFIYQNFTNDKTMNKSISSSLCILASYSILLKLLSYFFHPRISEKILLFLYTLFGIFLGMPYVFFRLLLPKLPLIKTFETKERFGICMILGMLVYPRMVLQLQFLLPNVIMFYNIFERKSKGSIKFLLCIFQISFFHQVDIIELLFFQQFRLLYGSFYICNTISLFIFPNYFKHFFKVMIDILSKINHIQFPVYMSIPIFMGCLFIILPLLYPKMKRSLYYMICIVLILSYSKVNFFPTTVFFSIGQGDFALVDFGFMKEKVLIDCGGSQSIDTYEKYVRPYIKVKGINIDAVYISHPDFDHIGALSSVQKDFPAIKVVEDFSDVDTRLFNVLNMKHESYEANDNSMVLYTKLGKVSYLFTGDAGITVESEILQNYPKLDIDVLKVGHHGSHTSSSDAFIRRLSPRYSIISVKYKSRYGHPHKSVLETLLRNQSKVLLTSIHGAIKILHTPYFSILYTASGQVEFIF